MDIRVFFSLIFKHKPDWKKIWLEKHTSTDKSSCGSSLRSNIVNLVFQTDANAIIAHELSVVLFDL